MKLLPFPLLALSLPLAAAEPVRPNIIVILADDLGWAKLGCYGQQKIRTPHLDRMAAEGQRWTQFYSGAPVCSPSRNVLLTSRHTGGCNVQDLKRVNPKETPASLAGDWPMDARQYTLHQAFKKIGDATAAFGKWGMGEYGTTGAPDQKGIDYFYGYTDYRVCHTFYPPFLWRHGVRDPINDPGIPGHAARAIDFIERNAERPFFLYFAPNMPHVRLFAGDAFRGQSPRGLYGDVIREIDSAIGEILRALDEKKINDRTLVIFTSDNGPWLSYGDHAGSAGPLREGKGTCWEGGVRAPCLMRWPEKIPAATECAEPLMTIDLLPTLAALLKVPLPERPIDGRDAWPHLAGTACRARSSCATVG